MEHLADVVGKVGGDLCSHGTVALDVSVGEVDLGFSAQVGNNLGAGTAVLPLEGVNLGGTLQGNRSGEALDFECHGVVPSVSHINSLMGQNRENVHKGIALLFGEQVGVNNVAVLIHQAVELRPYPVVFVEHALNTQGTYVGVITDAVADENLTVGPHVLNAENHFAVAADSQTAHDGKTEVVEYVDGCVDIVSVYSAEGETARQPNRGSGVGPGHLVGENDIHLGGVIHHTLGVVNIHPHNVGTVFEILLDGRISGIVIGSLGVPAENHKSVVVNALSGGERGYEVLFRGVAHVD